MQYFTTSKQQLDAELSDTKQKLSAAVQQKDELINTTAELRRQLDSKQHDLQAKEEAVASLQKDIKQLLQEFNMQAGDMKNTLHKQEKEIKESHETNEALKKALENQEEFTKTIHAQNSNLQEKISCLEDEHAVTISNLKDTEAKLQIASSEIESLKKDIQIVNDKKQGLENVIKAKDDLLVKYEKEVEQIKSHLRGVEGEKDQVSSELSRVEDEGKLKAARVEELETSLKVLQTKMADLQAELVKERETTAQKVSELTSSIQQKDKELDDNAGTIGRLMADVKAACEARARTELALQRSRHDHELDREAFKDNERKFLKQIEQLEGNVRVSSICIEALRKKCRKQMLQQLGENPASLILVGSTELALQRSRHDHELDREAFKDNERKFLKQIEQLEGNVRSKDDELSKQMSIILEIRVEKERLQSKIEGMQGTIDNIQKELTGRTAHSVPAPPPEHDDNALMCPPTKVTKITGEAKLPAPNGEPKQLDNMLFSLFSDGSMDGDTIDPFEVNRRFDALSRGERVSPLPLGSLKRRAGVPISHGGLKHKTTPDVDNISLSQVKNDMKNKDKTFFKNKRLEPKTRKPK
ncbi:unnamed protein product [Chilo suppressalis]|uniref:Synaptonemal complex protein 1 n=1 Tax=Chilo suppressalis TaxID=168631 RepID=A0ABN8L7F2_CHISP|nr:unnamed protein product [Chilo suppressalis]